MKFTTKTKFQNEGEDETQQGENGTSQGENGSSQGGNPQVVQKPGKNGRVGTHVAAPILSEQGTEDNPRGDMAEDNGNGGGGDKEAEGAI